MVCLQSVSDFFDDAVQCFIRSQRIVVRQNNMFCFGVLRQFDYELNGAVTPSYFRRVFCCRILRVMNQKIRAFDKIGVLLIRSKKSRCPSATSREKGS